MGIMVDCYLGKYFGRKRVIYTAYFKLDDKIIHEILRNADEIIDFLRYYKDDWNFDAVTFIPMKNNNPKIQPVDKEDFEHIKNEHRKSLESWLIFFSLGVKQGIPL